MRKEQLPNGEVLLQATATCSEVRTHQLFSEAEAFHQNRSAAIVKPVVKRLYSQRTTGLDWTLQLPITRLAKIGLQESRNSGHQKVKGCRQDAQAVKRSRDV